MRSDYLNKPQSVRATQARSGKAQETQPGFPDRPQPGAVPAGRGFRPRTEREGRSLPPHRPQASPARLPTGGTSCHRPAPGAAPGTLTAAAREAPAGTSGCPAGSGPGSARAEKKPPAAARPAPPRSPPTPTATRQRLGPAEPRPVPLTVSAPEGCGGCEGANAPF